MVGELGIFGTLVQNLNDMGFYGFILPWLVVFAIFYGILQKSGVLGGDKRIDGVVSLAIGTYFVTLFGSASMIISAILIAVLFLAMAGFKFQKTEDNKEKVVTEVAVATIVIAAILFFAFGGSAISGISLSSEAWAGIFMVIVILFALWFIGGSEKKGQGGQGGHV